MNISIAEAHNRLSYWLKEVQKAPVTITKRGRIVGVLIDPDEYDELRHVKAYLELITISREIGKGASADEIYRASRQDLEDRL